MESIRNIQSNETFRSKPVRFADLFDPQLAEEKTIDAPAAHTTAGTSLQEAPASKPFRPLQAAMPSTDVRTLTPSTLFSEDGNNDEDDHDNDEDDRDNDEDDHDNDEDDHDNDEDDHDNDDDVGENEFFVKAASLDNQCPQERGTNRVSQPSEIAGPEFTSSVFSRARPNICKTQPSAPFGIKALAPVFPLWHESCSSIAAPTRAAAQLLQHSAATNPVNELQPVAAGKPDHESTAGAQRLHATSAAAPGASCVRALRKYPAERIVSRLQAASNAYHKSREIMNLNELSRAALDALDAGVGKCSPALNALLQQISLEARQWCDLRSQVAQVLHQTKMREAQERELRDRLKKIGHALVQEKQMAAGLLQFEQRTAADRGRLVDSLLLEVAREMRSMPSLDKIGI